MELMLKYKCFDLMQMEIVHKVYPQKRMHIIIWCQLKHESYTHEPRA